MPSQIHPTGWIPLRLRVPYAARGYTPLQPPENAPMGALEKEPSRFVAYLRLISRCI